MKSVALKAVINFFAIAVSTALGILILKSIVECVLYSQTMAVRMVKNAYAFVADIFVLELSLPICMTLDGRLKKIIGKGDD
jgi:Na+-translocating ferredoxin:NAD+ oxidoreductase RnfE subunit